MKLTYFFFGAIVYCFWVGVTKKELIPRNVSLRRRGLWTFSRLICPFSVNAVLFRELRLVMRLISLARIPLRWRPRRSWNGSCRQREGETCQILSLPVVIEIIAIRSILSEIQPVLEVNIYHWKFTTYCNPMRVQHTLILLIDTTNGYLLAI